MLLGKLFSLKEKNYKKILVNGISFDSRKVRKNDKVNQTTCTYNMIQSVVQSGHAQKPTKYKNKTPAISRWRRGLNVNRPKRSAVLSPKIRAIFPCEYSCTVKENKMTGVINTINCVLFKPNASFYNHQQGKIRLPRQN